MKQPSRSTPSSLRCAVQCSGQRANESGPALIGRRGPRDARLSVKGSHPELQTIMCRCFNLFFQTLLSSKFAAYIVGFMSLARTLLNDRSRTKDFHSVSLFFSPPQQLRWHPVAYRRCPNQMGQLAGSPAPRYGGADAGQAPSDHSWAIAAATRCCRPGSRCIALAAKPSAQKSLTEAINVAIRHVPQVGDDSGAACEWTRRWSP